MPTLGAILVDDVAVRATGERLGCSNRRIAIAYASNGGGGYRASMLFPGVTRLLRRAALAQVWIDHICCRPAAASAFRLTLKDGAEPSLGAPGPE